MQVQEMTTNIRKMTVNPRSSKYMYINKSESEDMHGKRYREHRYTQSCDKIWQICDKYTKHAINISMDKLVVQAQIMDSWG